jgi:hypothetical protein
MSPGLPHKLLQWVVGFLAAPVLRRHVVVNERFADPALQDLRSFGLPRGAQLLHYLESFFFNGLAVLLGMSGVQHGSHFF